MNHTAHHPAGTVEHHPVHDPDRGERRSWAVLAIALTAQLLVVLDISVVNTALPTIGSALSLRGSDLQWLVTAYLLMSGGGLLLGGRIADLLRRRRVFMSGLAVFTTASLVSGFATGAGMLIGARAAQGLGAALMTPAALSIIMTTYAGSQRAKGLAMWGALGSVGIAAGVLFGGALTTWVGWQMIFWVNVPIGAAAFVAAWLLIPNDAATSVGLRQLDLPGAFAAVSGLGALLLGIQGAGDHGWTSFRTLGLLVLAAILLGSFTQIERRVPRFLVPPHTWAVKSLVSGTTVMLSVTGILVGAIFLTSVFVQTVLGYTAMQTGLAVLPLAVAMTFSAHAASHLLTKVSPRAVAAAGLISSAAAAALLSRVSNSASYVTDLLPGLIVMGLGVGLVFVAVSVTAMAGIPSQHAGMASGFLMTGHEIGAALGVAVVSAVAATAGSLTSPSGAAHGYSRGLVAVVVVGVISAAIAFTTMSKTRTSGAAGMHMHH
jgi:EmrB/QacA subfamily drug resistance transporter